MATEILIGDELAYLHQTVQKNRLATDLQFALTFVNDFTKPNAPKPTLLNLSLIDLLGFSHYSLVRNAYEDVELSVYKKRSDLIGRSSPFTRISKASTETFNRIQQLDEVEVGAVSAIFTFRTSTNLMYDTMRRLAVIKSFKDLVEDVIADHEKLAKTEITDLPVKIGVDLVDRCSVGFDDVYPWLKSLIRCGEELGIIFSQREFNLESTKQVLKEGIGDIKSLRPVHVLDFNT